jgi:hypothetical protein
LKAKIMSLSPRLRNLDLTLECKYCGHPKIKHGQWFVSVAKFKCEKCSREVGLPYRDKLALFKKHAHLIPPGDPTTGVERQWRQPLAGRRL